MTASRAQCRRLSILQVEAQRVQQAEASARFRGLQELARAQRSTIDGLKKEVEELKKEIEELKKAAEDSKQQAATAPAENPAAAVSFWTHFITCRSD